MITRILCNEIDEGRFSIVRFYERRMRRIAPALFAVIFASLIAAYFIFMPQEAADLGKSIRYTLLMAANLYWWKSLDYFAAPLDTKPMLHMWSLAIEEQFYLFLPVVLLLVARFWARSRPIVLWVLLIVSFISCIFMMQKNTPTAFYWLPFRAWELLAGSVLIFLPTSNFLSSRMRNVIALFGISFLLAPIFLLDSASYFPGFNAVPAVLGSALLIWVGTGPKTLVASALSFKPVVYVGLISYSLYLWHWPMIVFARYYNINNLPHAKQHILLALIFIVAILSYHFIEKPFRKKNKISAQSIFQLTFGIGAVFLASAILFSYTNGLLFRLKQEARSYLAGAQRDFFINNCDLKAQQRIGELRGCSLGVQNKEPTVLLLGDSFSGAMASGFDEFLTSHDQAGFLVYTSACIPVVGLGSSWQGTAKKCELVQSNIIDFIENNKFGAVVFHANWAGIEAKNSYKWSKINKDNSFNENIKTTFNEMVYNLIQREVKIILIRQGPAYLKPIPSTLARMHLLGKDPNISMSLLKFKNKLAIQDWLFDGFQKNEEVLLLDQADILCPNGICYAQKDRTPLYYDASHLNEAGSKLLLPIYEPIVHFLGWNK